MSQEFTHCPHCGLTKSMDTFKRLDTGWRCGACFYIVPDEKLEIEYDLNEVYRDLENGRFEKVLCQTAQLRPVIEEKYPYMLPWLDYVELRADFRILGPIVDGNGVDTECFTPCIIDVFSPEQIMKYKFRGKVNRELENIKGNILDSARNYQDILENYRANGLRPFDVFLCHKTDDNGKQNTRDYEIAKRMYRELTKVGYKVFFAPETKKTAEGIRKLGEYDNNWREWIYDALLSSKVMIVIATKVEYLTSPNVRNEWVTFRNFKDDNYYGDKMILPVFDMSCANQCLRLISDGDDSSLRGDTRRYENYYNTFLTDKAKLDVKSFVRVVGENVERLQGKDRPFDVDVTQLYGRALQMELENREFAIKLYKDIWKRFHHSDSALRLGLLSTDQSEAVKWFELAHSPVGDAYLAHFTYNGWGVKQNKQQAFELIESNEDSLAVYYRALFVVKEILSGVQQPFGKNELYVRNCIAALRQIRDTVFPARVLYGLCVYQGIGVAQNVELARKLLKGTDEYFELFGEE